MVSGTVRGEWGSHIRLALFDSRIGVRVGDLGFLANACHHKSMDKAEHRDGSKRDADDGTESSQLVKGGLGAIWRGINLPVVVGDGYRNHYEE